MCICSMVNEYGIYATTTYYLLLSDFLSPLLLCSRWLHWNSYSVQFNSSVFLLWQIEWDSSGNVRERADNWLNGPKKRDKKRTMRMKDADKDFSCSTRLMQLIQRSTFEYSVSLLLMIIRQWIEFHWWFLRFSGFHDQLMYSNGVFKTQKTRVHQDVLKRNAKKNTWFNTRLNPESPYQWKWLCATGF